MTLITQNVWFTVSLEVLPFFVCLWPPLFTKCMISCHLTPALISLLIPSYLLPAVRVKPERLPAVIFTIHKVIHTFFLRTGCKTSFDTAKFSQKHLARKKELTSCHIEWWWTRYLMMLICLPIWCPKAHAMVAWNAGSHLHFINRVSRKHEEIYAKKERESRPAVRHIS